MDYNRKNPFRAAENGYNPEEVDRYIEELKARLSQFEMEQENQKHYLGDAMFRAEEQRFQMEKYAREQAENVVSEASAEAKQIKTAAIEFSRNVHKQVEAYLNSMLQIRQDILSETETVRQNAVSLFQKIDGINQGLQLTILERQAEQTETKKTDSFGKNNQYNKELEEILKGVPGPIIHDK